nr:MAG TPA: hypothetical protein [Caudoviricetes sp.]
MRQICCHKKPPPPKRHKRERHKIKSRKDLLKL